MSTDLDARLRAADPYAPVELAGADSMLREEILHQFPVDPVVVARVRRIRQRRTSLRSRLAVSMATAAAVAGVLVAPTLMDRGPEVTPPTVTPPTGQLSGTDGEPVDEIEYVAAALEVARANPRVLVTAAGWSVQRVGGFEPTQGEMTFQQGPDQPRTEVVGDTALHLDDAATLSVSWYPREEYAGYRESRLVKGQGRETELWDRPVVLTSWGPDAHSVQLAPEGDVFLELRVAGLQEDAFLALLANSVERVDVPTWLAALPPEIVTARSVQEELDRVLADVPLPPGLDRGALGITDSETALDPYHFGAWVTGEVACGWIEEWLRARDEGDAVAAQRAVDQLATSHDWQVLKDMSSEGGWSHAVWEYADLLVAGERPAGYRTAICN